MPNIGFPELIVVLVIALLVFGPKRLPEVGRQIGRTIREFRDATGSIRSELGIDDMVDDVNDIKSQMTVDLSAPSAAGEPQAAAGEPQAAAPAAQDPAAAGAPEPVVAPEPVDAPAPVDPPLSTHAGTGI
jgi:sec-independent protein translocase protein TatA